MKNTPLTVCRLLHAEVRPVLNWRRILKRCQEPATLTETGSEAARSPTAKRASARSRRRAAAD
jgi:hypothetical protein